MSLKDARAAGYPQNEAIYLKLVEPREAGEQKSEALAQEQETAFLELGKVYAEHEESAKLAALVATARTATATAAKSKSAKIIRSLLESFAGIPGSEQAQIETIKECVEWSIKESRTFLRQNLDLRLVALWHKTQEYQRAIETVVKLLAELKKLDDKLMLVEVQLLEARIFHSLRNLAKARSSITSARTSANSVYTPTRLQAELDTMSGILLAEDGDYKTAFSYFYEALEGCDSLGDKYAVTVVKYLLLVKIMLNLTDDIDQLMANRTVKKYAGPDVDAMLAVARAHSDRSLKEFERVISTNRQYLETDSFIRSHFSTLYDKLLQDNLLKVIEPYSCVEVSFLATKLSLDVSQVEGKLGQMVLDKVLNGVLDQGNGFLYVYQPTERDDTYEFGLETIKHMSTVVDLLYDKASLIRQ